MHAAGLIKKSERQHTRLEFPLASFEVIKQVIYSYKCDNCGKIIRAYHLLPLFEGSFPAKIRKPKEKISCLVMGQFFILLIV